MNSLVNDLAGIVGADAVSHDDADRSAYAHDLWPRQLIATRAGSARPAGPGAIVWPSSTEALAEIVRFAQRTGARLAPFGAGSAVTGALALERDVIAVDTKRLRTLHRVDLESGTARADAGILGEHLEEQLQRRGATLGHFPSSIYCSTLGGWVATRSAGQCSGRYGKIEDMVVSLDGVLPTGEIFHAGAPLAGDIDMRSLLVGNEGLFGFLTQATLRVWPAPTERRFGAWSFGTMAEAWEAIRTIYQAGMRPAMTRLYDPFDSYLFKSGGRAHAPRTESAGTRKPLSEFVLRRVLNHPSLINQANRRWGDRVFGRSLLLVMFEGSDPSALDAGFADTARLARAGGGTDAGEALARRWLTRRHAVSYRQPPAFARGLWVDTMEVAAPWSRLGELYRQVGDALARGGFVMAHMSHAYPDGCSIYFTFAGANPNDDGALVDYQQTWARALEAAHAAGGTIAHHHGVGRSKRGAMRLEMGAGVGVIAALAHASDPHGVMARGPLVHEADDGTAPVHSPWALDDSLEIDTLSRVCRTPTDAPLERVHDALTAQGLALPDAPSSGTVGAWLGQAEAEMAPRDPVDHRVAGYHAVLPSGADVRLLPCPRRACGPELFPLFAQGGTRYGALRSVALRVHKPDERSVDLPRAITDGPRGTDEALASWLARVDLSKAR